MKSKRKFVKAMIGCTATLLVSHIIGMQSHVSAKTPASNNNGSGTCWQSGAAWSGNSVNYKIDSSIPSAWNSSVNTSAQTWTNVFPSAFSLSNNSSSTNTISKGTVSNNSYIALTSVYANATTINRVVTVFNQNKSFGTALPLPSGSHYVQEIMTHEFGHWLYLYDQYSSSCNSVTMYGTFNAGETFRTSLDGADGNGANYQYP